MIEDHGAYREFVDELVSIAKINVPAARIRAWGHSERDNEYALPLDEQEAAQKQFCLSLKPEQREILAVMLEDARMGAVHDVASFLEGALSSDQMEISWRSKPIPNSPYITMHADFYSRYAGDSWSSLA